MSWGMDAPGDISDEFDDDTLKTSIERADHEGQWRDSSTGFVDPKLETLKKQLAEPERASYTERRMRELQQQAARKAADAAAAAAAAEAAIEAETTAFGQPSPIDWRETVVASPVGTGIEPTPSGPRTVVADPSYVSSNRSVHPVWSNLQPIVSGLCVFAPIAALQVLLTGWHYDLLLRTLVASGVAGFLWQQFDVERFRAALIGVAVHLLAFFVTASSWGAYELIGNSVGFVIALLGSLVVGTLRESHKLLADRAR